MKLSEYKNEDALDLLADLIEPTAEIIGDKELAEAIKQGKPKLVSVKLAIKNHKDSILQILARLNGVEVKDFNCNLAEIITQVLELLNDEGLLDFFTSLVQTEGKKPSGTVTEITKAKKK